jgi:hypothetical protein
LQNVTCYVVAGSAEVIKCNSASIQVRDIVVSNVFQPDTVATLYMRFSTNANTYVSNTLSQITFYNAFAGASFVFQNVGGIINTTNIPSTAYVYCSNCALVNDAAEVSTLFNCVLTNGLFVQSGKVKETTLAIAAGATNSWAGIIRGDILVKSVHTFNSTAITGTLTGYDIGYTAAAGTIAQAWGSNISISNGAVNGIYDYLVTSPIYGPDNANRDIILTAVGGVFATGSIKICMIYEKFNVITS